MFMRRMTVFLAAVMLATSLFGGPGKAGDYPGKRLHMTILFGAGAGADVLGRKLAELASKELGQTIVCSNRLGGGGAVGYQYVLGTAPDGYNICWNSTSINVVYHRGNMKQDYSAFAGVANITQEMSALAVRADAPWKTIDEFIQHAKDNPGEVTIANSGVGSFNHLTAAALEGEWGVKVKHIPLNANESTTALLGGKVDAVVNMAFDIIQQQNAGTMRALLVVGDKVPQLPDAPSSVDLGYSFNLTMWRGIVVPAGTPENVIAVLEKAFMKVAASAEFKEFADKYGVVIDIRGAKDFDKLMAESDVVVANIMDKLGIKKQ